MAAVGGTAEVMEHVANGDYEMVGTFNGNPLAMAATRAMLCEVATPERLPSGSRRCARAPSAALERGDRAHTASRAHVVSVGAKGCVVFTDEPVRDFRGFLRHRRLATATRTGCSSTTAACSCRRGARSSSG